MCFVSGWTRRCYKPERLGLRAHLTDVVRCPGLIRMELKGGCQTVKCGHCPEAMKLSAGILCMKKAGGELPDSLMLDC